MKLSDKLDARLLDAQRYEFLGLGAEANHFRSMPRLELDSSPYCGETFLNKDHLRNHVKIVHCGESPFSCLDCGMIFPNKDHLRHHVKIVH